MNIFYEDPTIWVAVSFVLFVLLAVVFGRGIVTKMLDDKIENIRSQIATAENLRNEAQKLLMEYEAKQKAAATEAQSLLENAKRQAADLHARAEAELTSTMERRESMMKERIQRMEETAIDDIRRYAAELAISATTEIIAQKLDNASAQRLADESIRKVSENLN